MKPLKQFSVPFTGLKLGKHDFEFEIDDAFFNEFEYSLIKSGKLKVQMEMDKQETMLLLNFRISGSVRLNCDKCLSDFDQQVTIEERQIVKFAEDNLESDDPEIIILNRSESEIDVSGLLYEMINVAVPYIKNCSNGGNGQQCDQQMIDKLESLSAENNEETETVDPRWEALKKLK
ncbi:hypothetical protein C7T94_05745 [Pedobacter yulinensis]|uniref:DNA-binding protein n=1 Tax=Pedobacter yulinensis TaxID=2126353 RepID=A0A2T3HP50_9SPHI|nr:DUF177 domain-containing protein [Pedobacter yulinensis]PST84224.1 hypothetical protein C7T94_05745 [Pedobacter yulinensis]